MAQIFSGTDGTTPSSWTTAGGGGGTGDVVGPASSTDNAIARFDLTTGKLIQNSSVIVDDSGSITGVASLAAVTASITSANLATAVVTTLTATGASIASANAGTAVITTLTLTNALGVANGGTGQTTYTDGQLLIGNTTGNTLTKSTLTAGSGITITNGAGSITIAASGGGGGGAQDYIVQSYGIV